MSPQLINISHRIVIDAFLYHCQDPVIYMLKPGMLGSHGLGTVIEVLGLATKLHDVCVCVVHWPAVLLKLKLVSHL